jgi:hypothetical protein
MGPEIGFGMGKAADGRPRPPLVVRLLEMVGLALVIIGLLGGQLWLAAPGAAMGVASYALYRRKHGPTSSRDGVRAGDAGDGGD